MQKFFDQLQKIPLTTKLAALVAIIGAITAANYFLFIDPVEESIIRLQAQQKKLDDDLIQKQVIANNLNQFKREKEALEQRLAQAITELPNSAEIDELLRQLNDVGKKAGLEITSVAPGKEAPESFYIKIPIAMSVSGSYEEIAVFFESVSKLRRIVNIGDVHLGAPTKKSEKMVLAATFGATTFRFQDAGAKASKKSSRGSP